MLDFSLSLPILSLPGSRRVTLENVIDCAHYTVVRPQAGLLPTKEVFTDFTTGIMKLGGSK